MANVTQLGYLGIGVRDLDAWEGFATEFLVLQISARGDDGAFYLRMDEYHHRFIVHPGDQDDLTFVGWEVADQHALESINAPLEKNGVEVTKGKSELAASRRVTDRDDVTILSRGGPRVSRRGASTAPPG